MNHSNDQRQKAGSIPGRECHGQRHGITHIMACTGHCRGCGVGGGRRTRGQGARQEGAQEPGDGGGERILPPRSHWGLHVEQLWGMRAPLGSKPQDSSRAQLARVSSCHPRRGFSPGLGMLQGTVPTREAPYRLQAAASRRASSYCQLTWPRFPAAPFSSPPPTLELEATSDAASGSQGQPCPSARLSQRA